jgi:Spy/CpxP family protein refolding chaperone
MKKRIALIATIITIGALAAAPLAARPGGRGHAEAGILRDLHEAREELGLSDAQVGKIVSIFAELRQQNAQYRDDARGGRKAVLDTLLADPGNLAAAKALVDERNAAQLAMKTNALHATSQALSVLSAEQRSKLGTLLAERRGRRGRRGR